MSKTLEQPPKVKPVPKDVEKYAHSLLSSHHNLYYKRFGKSATVTCAACGQTYTGLIERPTEIEKSLVKVIDLPMHNTEGKCERCGAPGIYKAEGRVKSFTYEEWTDFVVGQNLGDDFVFRAFSIKRKSRKNLKDAEEMTEYARLYLSKGKKAMEWWHRSYYGQEYWYKGNPSWYGECKINRSNYWPGTLHEIEKTPMLRYGDPERYDLIDYYSAFSRYPDFELVQKAGMTDLMHALLCQYGANINPRGKSIADRLRVNKDRLKELRERKGNLTYLHIFQEERKSKTRFTREQIEERLFMAKKCSPTDRRTYELILEHTTLHKVLAYLEEQRKKKIYEYTYLDYIRMRHRAGYDLSNEVYLFPKDLRRRHDEMVRMLEKKKNDEYKEQMEKKWPKIREKSNKLDRKYSYKSGKYLIRPAMNAMEIVEEGRVLHHCVGSSDTYFQKHSKGTSYILFLRSAKEPEKPLATVELSSKGTVLQWYEAYDKQPDKKSIQSWLNRYVKHLKEKGKKKTATA